MNNLISRTLLFILVPFLLTNTSCSKDCGSALADLITDITISGIVTITTGVPFNIPNVIQNVPNTIEMCKDDIINTVTAGPSESKLAIDYDISQDGQFSLNELDELFDVPSIESGVEQPEDYGFIFNEPGDYRLITFTDATEKVEERIEDNNASDSKFTEAGKMHDTETNTLIIRVTKGAEYKKGTHEEKVTLLYRNLLPQRPITK